MSDLTLGAPNLWGGDTGSGTGGSTSADGQFSFGAPSVFSNPGSFNETGLSDSFFSQSSPQVQSGGGDGGDFAFSRFLGSALEPIAQGAGRAISRIGQTTGNAIGGALPQDINGRIRRQFSDQLRNPTFQPGAAETPIDGRFFRRAFTGGNADAPAGVIPGVSNGALIFGAVALIGVVMVARG